MPRFQVSARLTKFDVLSSQYSHQWNLALHLQISTFKNSMEFIKEILYDLKIFLEDLFVKVATRFCSIALWHLIIYSYYSLILSKAISIISISFISQNQYRSLTTKPSFISKLKKRFPFIFHKNSSGKNDPRIKHKNHEFIFVKMFGCLNLKMQFYCLGQNIDYYWWFCQENAVYLLLRIFLIDLCFFGEFYSLISEH